MLFQGALSAEMTPTVHAVLVATLHTISAGGKGPGKEDTSPAQSNKVVFARGAGGPRVSREALAVASGAQAHTVSCTHQGVHYRTGWPEGAVHEALGWLVAGLRGATLPDLAHTIAAVRHSSDGDTTHSGDVADG